MNSVNSIDPDLATILAIELMQNKMNWFPCQCRINNLSSKQLFQKNYIYNIMQAKTYFTRPNIILKKFRRNIKVQSNWRKNKYDIDISKYSMTNITTPIVPTSFRELGTNRILFKKYQYLLESFKY
jgi:hypothetical protein